MKKPRLLVSSLIEEAQRAADAGYRSLPVTLRVQHLDGTTKDYDASAVEYHGNSGLLYVVAQEK